MDIDLFPTLFQYGHLDKNIYYFTNVPKKIETPFTYGGQEEYISLNPYLEAYLYYHYVEKDLFTCDMSECMVNHILILHQHIPPVLNIDKLQIDCHENVKWFDVQKLYYPEHNIGHHHVKKKLLKERIESCVVIKYHDKPTDPDFTMILLETDNHYVLLEIRPVFEIYS